MHRSKNFKDAGFKALTWGYNYFNYVQIINWISQYILLYGLIILPVTLRREYEMRKLRKVVILEILIIVCILFATSSVNAASTIAKSQQSVEARVIEMLPNKDDGKDSNNISNRVKVEITSGKHKSEILTVDNLVDDKVKDSNVLEVFNVKNGNEVMLYIEENNDGSISSAYIYDFVRYKYVTILAIIFIILFIIIGGKKGFKSLITLFLTGVAIVKIIIPIIMKGLDPVIPTILVCIALLIINLLIVSGLNKKTFAAIIGTASGLLSSVFIILIVGNVMRFTGVSSDDVQALTYIPMEHAFNFKGLFFAAILLGTLGAAIDIGISISSAMYEVEINNSNITKKQLIKSGMNVGRDILGAMANTLMLAYASEAIVTIVILLSYKMSFMEIINQDVIASEIFKALAGSIGLIFTIPATVFTMAYLKK